MARRKSPHRCVHPPLSQLLTNKEIDPLKYQIKSKQSINIKTQIAPKFIYSLLHSHKSKKPPSIKIIVNTKLYKFTKI